jgi:hypothetical protein
MWKGDFTKGRHSVGVCEDEKDRPAILFYGLEGKSQVARIISISDKHRGTNINDQVTGIR